MTREDYIKALIRSHGYTLKDFARIIRMPYTTLLSILNGSIGGAALDNVLKICQALGLRIEDLPDGGNKKEQASALKGNADDHLLMLIRSLPPEKKNALKILLAGKKSL